MEICLANIKTHDNNSFVFESNHSDGKPGISIAIDKNKNNDIVKVSEVISSKKEVISPKKGVISPKKEVISPEINTDSYDNENHYLCLILFEHGYLTPKREDIDFKRLYTFRITSLNNKSIPIIPLIDIDKDFKYKVFIKSYLKKDWEIGKSSIESIKHIKNIDKIHIYGISLKKLNRFSFTKRKENININTFYLLQNDDDTIILPDICQKKYKFLIRHEHLPPNEIYLDDIFERFVSTTILKS